LSIIGDSSQAFSPFRAEVAELADAQASGACGRKVVEVQILSSAPPSRNPHKYERFLSLHGE
jgi:hypothetical protein